jgi:hypothetical protein
MDAALQLACRLDVGNLRDTDHSTESTPTAAMAELCELAPSRSLESREARFFHWGNPIMAANSF